MSDAAKIQAAQQAVNNANQVASSSIANLMSTRITNAELSVDNNIALFTQGDLLLKQAAQDGDEAISSAQRFFSTIQSIDHYEPHVKGKKLAKNLEFMFQRSQPVYLEKIKDNIRKTYSDMAFIDGRRVAEGSRLYPVQLMKSIENDNVLKTRCFANKDLFKAYTMWKLYNPKYSDPRDTYRHYVSSKRFSPLLLGRVQKPKMKKRNMPPTV